MNMLEGPMTKNIILFAAPLALSSILQQFFNSADVAVVGNFAGSLPLAAVGANVANVGIFVNFIVGSSIGPNVIVARLIGEGKSEKIHRTIESVMAFALLLGCILLGLGQAITRFSSFGQLLDVYPVSWFLTFGMLYIAYRLSLRKKSHATA